jgi:4-hydroxybenzoate polyprenyltransferase
MYSSLETTSRILITLAILLQLFMLRTSKRLCSTSFFIWSVASYMMTYDYYTKDNKQFTQRVSFKLFNSTMLLLIAIFSR